MAEEESRFSEVLGEFGVRDEGAYYHSGKTLRTWEIVHSRMSF